jgi:FKBP-type peptidyl-prolyl cis-trans isomerase FkpA
LLLPQEIENGSLEEAYTILSPGDSATFLINARSIYENSFGMSVPENVNPDSLLTIHIKLIKLKTAKQIAEDLRNYELWAKEMKETEKAILAQYIKTNNITESPDNNGMYFFLLKNGEGGYIESGKTIFVRYCGKFLNEKEFDRADQAFEYTVGTQGQLIKGIEIALWKMRLGSKAKIIIPSELGFGAMGSTSGIVPPFTSTIYEIEILSNKQQ